MLLVWFLVGIYFDSLADTTVSDVLCLRLICKSAARAIGSRYRGRTFFLQDPAFAAAKRARELGVPAVRAWSFDRFPGKATKKFWVGTDTALHAQLAWLAPVDRCFYELLLCSQDVVGEDQNLCASRVYLDCEYARKYNSDMPSDADLQARIVESFIPKIARALCVNKESIRYVVAEAHNSDKFSIHIVFSAFDTDGTEVVLRDNLHVGALVRTWELEERDVDEDLYVVDKNGTRMSVIDNGVYTKHRMFRTMSSSKKGQDRFLKHNGSQDVSTRLWKSFLIQDVERSSARVVSILESNGDEPESLKYWHGERDVAPKKRHAAAEHADRPMKMPRTSHQTLASLLEAWVQHYTGDPSSHVIFHNSSVSLKSQTLTITAPNTKRCMVKGVQHSGNHVYFTIDSTNGKVRQKCHAARCRGDAYEIELPDWILEKIYIAAQLTGIVNEPY